MTQRHVPASPLARSHLLDKPNEQPASERPVRMWIDRGRIDVDIERSALIHAKDRASQNDHDAIDATPANLLGRLSDRGHR